VVKLRFKWFLYEKGAVVRLLKLSALLLLLMPGLFPRDGICAGSASQNDESSYSSDQKARQHKRETLRGVALSWIDIGTELVKRGLYEQAEQSFLAAGQYQEYLSAQENKNLQDQINKTRSAIVEEKTVSQGIQQAKDLIDKGQPVKARAVYEKIRNSPCLTDTERGKIADELKKIDSSFDRQKKEVTDLYNRSIELYRAGDLEKAREGFAEVAKSGLLVTPKGQSPEDYLLQIDSILTAQLKPESSEKPVSKQMSPPEENEPGPSAVSDNTDNTGISELDLLKPSPATQDNEQQNQNPQEEIADVTSAAEPPSVAERPESKQDKAKAKEKIIRTYTGAVVESAETRAEAYIGKGELNKAVTVIHNAASVVRENRPIIGDELFIQYSSRLKVLTDKIIEAGKTH
jgi:tetratricopeptide (TPR) repeat protein